MRVNINEESTAGEGRSKAGFPYQEGWTTAPSVDEQESGDSHEHVDNVLN
jgi:hypothetical protein